VAWPLEPPAAAGVRVLPPPPYSSPPPSRRADDDAMHPGPSQPSALSPEVARRGRNRPTACGTNAPCRRRRHNRLTGLWDDSHPAFRRNWPPSRGATTRYCSSRLRIRPAERGAVEGGVRQSGQHRPIDDHRTSRPSDEAEAPGRNVADYALRPRVPASPCHPLSLSPRHPLSSPAPFANRHSAFPALNTQHSL
jgi:hypothetical protein